MSEVLKKFGRYFFLDLLAQGGMAEIYRARLASEDGAGRLIVIKRIQAGFDSNSEFLKMFKSEIKVTMGFSHPNIVQLFDFGEEQNQPYIAMEWVDGKNLRQIINRFHELNQALPIDLAVYIAEQSSAGLQYAHSYKDKITGEPLNIVHRDISPQNILVSFEGGVKVIDFGIAKATTNSEATRAGIIKGKPSYLSPEQISGDILDGRSDVFALGIVLWEMLTGKKLFAGDNDLAILKLIESCQTHVKPPSTYNSKIPKELDYIVLKTLAKQREKRFQNAEELQRTLHKFLYLYDPDFNASDLSYFIKDIFKNEIVEDRKKIKRLSEKAELLLSAEIPSKLPSSESATQATVALSGEEKGMAPLTVTLAKRATSEPKSETSSQIPPKSLASRILPSPPIKSIGNIEPESVPSLIRPHNQAAFTRGQEETETEFQPQSLKRTVENPLPSLPKAVPLDRSNTQIPTVDRSGKGNKTSTKASYPFPTHFSQKTQKPHKSSPIFSFLSLSAGVGAFIYALPFFGIHTPLEKFFSSLSMNPNRSLTSTQQSSYQSLSHSSSIPSTTGKPLDALSSFGSPSSGTSTTTIALHLILVPAGGVETITINGSPIDSEKLSATVPLNTPLELSIERPGFKSFRREFFIDSQQVVGLKSWSMEVHLELLNFGFLTIHTTPSAEAIFTVDGATISKKTPLEDEKLPVGKYSIRLFNEVLGMEKYVSVSIEEGKSVIIDESLDLKN